jgi:NAD-dependent SIR2 family protein deacetylase
MWDMYLLCSLHYRAGSNPIELHGTTHHVICLDCGDLSDRYVFQDRVKALNPEVLFLLMTNVVYFSIVFL